MTKYNQSFKQQVIEFYLQCDKNQSLARQHFQIKDTTTFFVTDLLQYNYNDFNGLTVSYPRKIIHLS